MTIKMSDNGIPELVNEALQNLVRAVNETSPKCVGVVAVITFDDGSIVIPVIDKDIRVVSGVNPVYALVEEASVATAAKLEYIQRELDPKRLQ